VVSRSAPVGDLLDVLRVRRRLALHTLIPDDNNIQTIPFGQNTHPSSDYRTFNIDEIPVFGSPLTSAESATRRTHNPRPEQKLACKAERSR